MGFFDFFRKKKSVEGKPPWNDDAREDLRTTLRNAVLGELRLAKRDHQEILTGCREIYLEDDCPESEGRGEEIWGADASPDRGSASPACESTCVADWEPLPAGNSDEYDGRIASTDRNATTAIPIDVVCLRMHGCTPNRAHRGDEVGEIKHSGLIGSNV